MSRILMMGHELPGLGDAKTFAEHILTLAKEKTLQQKLATQAEKYINDRLSCQATTQPFQVWAKNPFFARPRPGSKACEIGSRRPGEWIACSSKEPALEVLGARSR